MRRSVVGCLGTLGSQGNRGAAGVNRGVAIAVVVVAGIAARCQSRVLSGLSMERSLLLEVEAEAKSLLLSR